jgi:hypothetical protein
LLLGNGLYGVSTKNYLLNVRGGGGLAVTSTDLRRNLPSEIWSMKSTALILLVPLVLTQSDVAQAPVGSPSGHFQAQCDDEHDEKQFAEKVCYTTFDPSQAGFGHSYQSPTCDGSIRVTDSQKDIIAKAYSQAPEYIKTRLCKLTHLFVTLSSQGSWSFWEGQDRPPGTGVYIGISEWKLESGRSIADGENEITDELVGFDGDNGSYGPRLPRLHTLARDPVLTVLSVLAHELGHLLLSDTNADGVDAGHPRRKVSDPPRSDCFEHAFLGLSWDAETFHQHMRRWVEFGEQNQNKRKNPELQFDLKQLREAIGRDDFVTPSQAITNVYRSREFVSFFASISPEEDFVETYKYKVLADAMRNQAINLVLDGQEINLLDYVQSGIPARKVECFRKLGLLTAQL